MVKQLQEKLSIMDAEMVEHLIQECLLRDEWREQRSERALRTLPSVAQVSPRQSDPGDSCQSDTGPVDFLRVSGDGL